VHYKHKQRRHRCSQKFVHWSAKSTFCLAISCCWRYNANGRSHNASPFLHHKENDLQLAQHDFGPSPKIFYFAVCISIYPYRDHYFNQFSANYMTYWSLGYYEMMQYWYCYVTIILKLEEFKSSGDIIQEGVLCCIRDSLVDHQCCICFWKYHFNMPEKYSNNDEGSYSCLE